MVTSFSLPTATDLAPSDLDPPPQPELPYPPPRPRPKLVLSSPSAWMTLTYQAIMGYKRNDFELPREGGVPALQTKVRSSSLLVRKLQSRVAGRVLST